MSRTWEFETNKAIPSDLVREQDFIMRTRRLNRLGAPYLIINLVLTAIESLARNRGALEAAQLRLQEFCKVTNGIYAEMSNGDVFVCWEETKDTHVLPSRLLAAITPEETGAADAGKFMLVYHMPDGYTQVRERINHYVEVVRSAAVIGEDEPQRMLQTDAARGPLTAWSVDLIEKLLGEIDLRRYVRTQSIYEYGIDGKWHAFSEEQFVSFDDLKRERFPRLEPVAQDHLFLELCQTLDRKLLAELSLHVESFLGRRIHFNLSVDSFVSPVFAQFCRAVPKDKRNLVGFELHRGDLFQDFARTLDAIGTIRREGFKVAIDGITPDMVNYLNFASFEVDFIKINVSKDRADQLRNPAVRRGLEPVAKEKLIFFRCDNDRALAAGLEMGVSKFQGWLIDDAVQQGQAG
jgi:EAL domain-containing protein (putative c-di-GMP-specific phosphodiesterase class I)